MSSESDYLKFPNEFFEEPFYKKLSVAAKILYTVLADRSEESENNKEFQDEDGTPFVQITIKEMAASLGCGTTTVKKALKELEDIGLISRVRQYACQANKIYVKDIGE